MKKVNRLRKAMQKNKKFIIPSLALMAALGSGAYGISGVSAQGTDNQTSIIERIANKFNLNKDEVQKVFEENRAERERIMQTNLEKRLNDAVTSGVLTEAQKTLILAKRVEMKMQAAAMRGNAGSEKSGWQNLTMEARQAEREKRQSERATRQADLTTWAKDNGIDVQYLMGHMGGRGGSGGFHQAKLNTK